MTEFGRKCVCVVGQSYGSFFLAKASVGSKDNASFDYVNEIRNYPAERQHSNFDLYVSGDVLDQIYKLYVRPHSDYGDIIYHKYDPEYTLELTKKLESIQYSAALAVSGSWRGTNTDRLLEELGWEYLYHRRWYRKLCHFYKLRNTQSPGYLFQHIPSERVVNYNLRNPDVLKQFF